MNRQPALKSIHIITRLNVGGPARHVLLLNAELLNRGYDALLVHGSTDAGEASLDHLAVAARFRTRRIAALGRRVSAISDLAALGELLRLMFAETPDVVHTHTAKAGALGRIAGAAFNAVRPRARRCVVLHTFHGHVFSGYFGFMGSRLVRFSEWILAALTDRLIALSPSQREELIERFRIAPAGKVTTIPLALDLTGLSARVSTEDARRDLGIPQDAFVLGYVGRFVPIKDLETLVRAFAAVVQQRPDALLLLAGGGPSRATLEAIAGDLKLQHRVNFLGWTTELPRLYAAMDVCCLSSLNEGTPVALIEAMAAQKPIVATAVGGVVDLVEDGRTGLLVAPRDPAAFARAILRLASDRDERHRMGESAGAAVARMFSTDQLVASIHSLYESELRKKRSSI